MAIKYDSTVHIRIIGIALSVVALILIFFKPFEFVLNTLLVYGFMIGAALLMVLGQILVLNIEPNEETRTKYEQQEILYDIATTTIVMILFIIFYAWPFVNKYVFEASLLG